MTTSEEPIKSNGDGCRATIAVSPFNANEFKKAFLMDHSMDGVTFLSDDAFFPGSAIVIRGANNSSNNACFSKYSGLPGLRIGEVKRCIKHAGQTSSAYEVVVKYYYLAY